ncbi:hypothetical protein [Streptomyces sp. NPDC003717]|uniref:hypothetical protein n=1 Tax=Streptomyces sp. NPDC003717 TaxID=3154276 RepID=UPI0033B95DDA
MSDTVTRRSPRPAGPATGRSRRTLLASAHGRCLVVTDHAVDLTATAAAPWSPGLRALPAGRATPTTPVLRYEEAGGPPELSWDEAGARLRAPWRDTADGAVLGYLAAVLMERDRQRRGYFSMHAAAASLDGRGVLLLGKEGAGKTSVLSRLCRHHGARLIGNDLTVLGGRAPRCELVAGTRFLFLRQASVDRSMADLDLPLPRRAGLDPWRTKWRVEPAEVSIDVDTRPRPVERVHLVHVDESQPDLRTGRADDTATLLHLHENAARYIRGTATHALHGAPQRPLGYIPSLDTAGLYHHRAAVLAHLAHEVGIEYVSGPATAVAAHVARGLR